MQRNLKLHIILLLLIMLNSTVFSEETINFRNLHKNSESVKTYSGKTIKWEGTLKELVSNQAFFDYRIELSSGETIRVLSNQGLQANMKDYLSFSGFIMIVDNKFSHIVLQEYKIMEKPTPTGIPTLFCGNYPMDAGDEKIYKTLINWISYYNRGVPEQNKAFIAERIIKYSRKNQVDPYLVTALMSAESAFNIYACSVVGAIGLGQLMPGTAAMLGVDPHDPEQNIGGSVQYLRMMLNRWKNTSTPVAFALASYNAGPGAVEKYNGIPPYQETIDYV
ncbi:MAG: lytic transglycosylase domain-containing protein, partial [Vulcanimicrobiota bacterium]